MLQKYLLCFFISMVPLIELRAGVPFAVGMGIDYFTALIICVIGNMVPVPIIYFFARKVLEWGRDKKYIGKFFTFCIEKGERGGQKPPALRQRTVPRRLSAPYPQYVRKERFHHERKNH